ncbi:MAG: FAD-dependent thymidylate synthase [Candidatus Sumerlaeia bacterium]|nr:FAD-dependent thymidylate synthase [Candidatus Sumerlaeia bacterium]
MSLPASAPPAAAPFLSAPPIIRLTKAFSTPYRNVVATARTCYSSKGIVRDEEVGEPEKFSPLARSIYEAGHHTTFQHAHFQFALENVSRHFIWSFLHAHPFYNSEQVSQRYVTVKADTMTVPALADPALGLFRERAEAQFAAYRRLCEMLEGPVEAAFFERFNRSERMEKKHRATIRKKAQEIARYVLPVGTHAYLYHTVSGVTLLRYWRVANQADVPAETRLVVGEMVRQLLEFDPEYAITLQEPLEPEAFAEAGVFAQHPELLDGARAQAFRAEFDAALDGRTAKLVGWSTGAEEQVASAVREVLGLCRGDLSDAEAVALALDPGRNRLLGESLNVTTLAKLSRALHHAHYTFRKKLSHTADSQDQRHRMTPGSRPVLAAHLDDAPDVVVPELLDHAPEARALFDETMARTWETLAQLRRLGVAPEWRSYLLPNAVSVRFTESSDLLNLRHKHQMRLCYNAQEEIWRASLDEALQVRERHPMLGRYLLPPCTLRAMAKARPICPEGPRYCGVVVWKKDVAEYERVI